MANHHPSPGEIIDLRPLGDRFAEAATATLVKAENLEVIRLILPAGKEIPSHAVAGPITVQCLEGRVAFRVDGKSQTLEPGQMLYLNANQVHAVKGIEDSSVLVTRQVPHPSPAATADN